MFTQCVTVILHLTIGSVVNGSYLGGCTWETNNVVCEQNGMEMLNLSTLMGQEFVSTSGSDGHTDGHTFRYTMCDNGVECNGEKYMMTHVDPATNLCSPLLKWDNGAANPIPLYCTDGEISHNWQLGYGGVSISDCPQSVSTGFIFWCDPHGSSSNVSSQFVDYECSSSNPHNDEHLIQWTFNTVLACGNESTSF